MIVICRKCGKPGRKLSDGKLRCDDCVRAYRRAYAKTSNGQAKRQAQAKRYRQGAAGKAAAKRHKSRVLSQPERRIQSRKTILRRYGMTPKDYSAMLLAQGGRCAICGGKFDHHLHVDHDHKTGNVRALLCRGCNNGLGNFNDEIDRIRKAIEYLETHQLTPGNRFVYRYEPRS